jgi:hypothetical protein
MKDSVTKITLGIGCVVTGLTLTTTCFLTVDAFLTYVKGDQSAAFVGEANAEPIVPRVIASRQVAADAIPDRTGAVSNSSTIVVARRPVSPERPKPPYVPELRQESATRAEPLVPLTPDPVSTGATVEPGAGRQDQAMAANGQQIAADISTATSTAEPARCDEGSLAGAICREAVRWNTCHPDGWNKTPECVVQQFDVWMQ